MHNDYIFVFCLYGIPVAKRFGKLANKYSTMKIFIVIRKRNE